LAQDSNPAPDEVEIEASKAPLIEHLVELRRRLMWSIVAFFIAFLICFAFSKPLYNFLLGPYQDAARAQTVFDSLIRLFYDHPIKTAAQTPIEMIFTAPQEFFFTQMKLAMFGAIFIAFPVIATQVYMFMAPGLYRTEKRAFLPYLVATPVLFILGGAVVYFVAMPLAMKFFLSMQQIDTGSENVQIVLTARVSEYLGLIMTLILGFGIIFQLPVVLTLLARVGMITADQLVTFRRYAIVGIFAVAAVLTPPDPISQIGMALPTLLLYEASIYAVRWVEKQRLEREAAAQAAG
jgi:sec-independent protein translocase protein TatC